MSLSDLSDLRDRLERSWTVTEAVSLAERTADTETAIVRIELSSDDAVLARYGSWPTEKAEQIDLLMTAIEGEIAAADNPDAVYRVHFWGPKSRPLGKYTVRNPTFRAPTARPARFDDLLDQTPDPFSAQVRSMLALMQEAVSNIADGWERLGAFQERLLRRASDEAHQHHNRVLQLSDKIATQQLQQIETRAKNAELEGKKAVAEAAIREAGGTVGKLMDAVVVGLGGSKLATALAPLASILEKHPDIGTLLTDPEVQRTLEEEPQLLNLVKSVLETTKQAAEEKKAAAAQPPEAEASQPEAGASQGSQG